MNMNIFPFQSRDYTKADAAGNHWFHPLLAVSLFELIQKKNEEKNIGDVLINCSRQVRPDMFT